MHANYSDIYPSLKGGGGGGDTCPNTGGGGGGVCLGLRLTRIQRKTDIG